MSLLREIEQHLENTGLAATRFGRSVANDPRLVLDMRRGRRPRAKVVRRIASALGGGQ
jgi:2,4-dienoyl-CoA reductase-like NADH-dependent reductase (Old Yellow Enzyme family)